MELESWERELVVKSLIDRKRGKTIWGLREQRTFCKRIKIHCAACHRNPIGLYVLYCLFLWFLGVILSLGRALTLKNSFAELCSTAGVWQLWFSLLSASVIFLLWNQDLSEPRLVGTVHCFSRAVKHVVVKAFVSLPLFLGHWNFPSSSGFHWLSLSIPCFLEYLPVYPHTHWTRPGRPTRANMSGLALKPQHITVLHWPQLCRPTSFYFPRIRWHNNYNYMYSMYFCNQIYLLYYNLWILLYACCYVEFWHYIFVSLKLL